MDAAQRHAMEVVRQADRDRYLSALYAPEEKRGHLFALYAFNAEVAAIRDRIHEPLPGEVRLQWWRDVLTGEGDAGIAGGSPVAATLLETIAAHDLPRTAFVNLLEARLFDLYDDPMPSRSDLEGYCGETASALIQLAALVLAADSAGETAALAGHAGCAQAIAGLLRLLPLHRARGQCYLPADILAAAGTTREEFLAGEGGEAISRAVAAMTALGREHLTAFEKGAGRLPASLRPAYLPLALTGAYLDVIASGRVDPLREVADISAARRHWRMFRRAGSGW